MIDKKWIGHSFPAFKVKIEEGQLQFFAKAVSEGNPIYTDKEEAIKAGYQNIPIPPTFPFSLKLAQLKPFENYKDMGIDLKRILHAEQGFQYFMPVVAGEVLTLESTILQIYEKKGGALTFMTEVTSAKNDKNLLVFKSSVTLVIRN